MAIVVPTNTGAGTEGGCVGLFPSAQSVVNSVSTDLLQRIAPEDPKLLDYINRAQLQLLRASRWKFLLSPLQRFVTQKDRTDYWIGPTGQGPIDTIDTGLNIQNLGPIKTETFYDRSNFRLLKRVSENVPINSFNFRDGSSRPGFPRVWRNDVSTPCTINIYPAPDNQNNFQPVPEAPACSGIVGVGSSLPARMYFVRTTFVDSLGNESSASDEARLFVPAGSVLVVQPPQEIPTAASGIQYNRFNVYIFNGGTNLTLSTGSEILATAAPLSTTAAYIEPIGGFVNFGLSFPTANNVELLGGYVIEFRYFQAKPQINNLSNTLLIPSDYFDVLVAGVNYFTAQAIKDQDAQQFWQAEWMSGITGMIRDKNLFPRGPDYIQPDPASISTENYFGYETIDQFNYPGSTP